MEEHTNRATACCTASFHCDIEKSFLAKRATFRSQTERWFNTLLCSDLKNSVLSSNPGACPCARRTAGFSFLELNIAVDIFTQKATWKSSNLIESNMVVPHNVSINLRMAENVYDRGRISKVEFPRRTCHINMKVCSF